MSKFDENLEKAKSAVKNTAQKVQNSDIADKAKTSVKNASQKIQENEAVNKMKEATGNAVQKAKENEKIAGAVDKINQNEYIAKANKSKYSKFIKIGAVVVALILLFNLFSFIFGDRNAKKAEEYLKTDIITAFEDSEAKNLKVETKVIGKNEENHLYAIDTIVSGKNANGENHTTMQIAIVYSDGNESYGVNCYDYDKENKNDVKEVALSALVRG